MDTLFLCPRYNQRSRINNRHASYQVQVKSSSRITQVTPTQRALFVGIQPNLRIINARNPMGVRLTIFRYAILYRHIRASFHQGNTTQSVPLLLTGVAIFLIDRRRIHERAIDGNTRFAHDAAHKELPNRKRQATAQLKGFTNRRIRIMSRIINPRTADVLIRTRHPMKSSFLIQVNVRLHRLFWLIFQRTNRFNDFFRHVLNGRNFMVFGTRQFKNIEAQVLHYFFRQVNQAWAMTSIHHPFTRIGILTRRILVCHVILGSVINSMIRSRRIELQHGSSTIVHRLRTAVLMNEGRHRNSILIERAAIDST